MNNMVRYSFLILLFLLTISIVKAQKAARYFYEHTYVYLDDSGKNRKNGKRLIVSVLDSVFVFPNDQIKDFSNILEVEITGKYKYDEHGSHIIFDTVLLKELKELREIKIECSKLGNAFKSFSVLPELESINLICTAIDSIGDEIAKNDKLVVLNVDAGNLSYISEGVGKLKNLMVVYLNSNLLTSIPIGLTKLNNLKNLDLSCAGSIPRCKKNNFNLIDYYDSNELQKLKTIIDNNPNLKKIRISPIGKHQCCISKDEKKEFREYFKTQLGKDRNKKIKF